MKLNNFDISSTGVNIEMELFRDAFQAQLDFKDSFIGIPTYGRRGAYLFVGYSGFENYLNLDNITERFLKTCDEYSLQNCDVFIPEDVARCYINAREVVYDLVENQPIFCTVTLNGAEVYPYDECADLRSIYEYDKKRMEDAVLSIFTKRGCSKEELEIIESFLKSKLPEYI